jgi:hypothetical protein
MFVKVPHTKLVVGKKYKIVGACNDYTGIYIGFEEGPYFNLLFGDVKSRFNHNNVLFSTYKDFYEFVPQAQAKMERRSVNMIVRRLLGDDCFEW